MSTLDSTFPQITVGAYFLWALPLLYAIAPKSGTMELAKFASSAIQERIQRYYPQDVGRNDSKSSTRDFMEKLFEVADRNPQENRQTLISGAASSNVVAGSDTTSITLISILFNILKHPHVLQKLRDELDDASVAGQISNPITFAESQSLPYLQAIFKESMRMHPATGLPMWRVVLPEGAVICNQHFSGGAIVGINSWVAHYNHDVYGKDVDEFRPDRWIDNNKETLNRMERYFMPFGLGSRTCIGKNISLLEIGKLVPQLVRRFDFQLLDTSKASLETKNMWLPAKSVAPNSGGQSTSRVICYDTQVPDHSPATDADPAFQEGTLSGATLSDTTRIRRSEPIPAVGKLVKLARAVPDRSSDAMGTCDVAVAQGKAYDVVHLSEDVKEHSTLPPLSADANEETWPRPEQDASTPAVASAHPTDAHHPDPVTPPLAAVSSRPPPLQSDDPLAGIHPTLSPPLSIPNQSFSSCSGSSVDPSESSGPNLAPMDYLDLMGSLPALEFHSDWYSTVGVENYPGDGLPSTSALITPSVETATLSSALTGQPTWLTISPHEESPPGSPLSDAPVPNFMGIDARVSSPTNTNAPTTAIPAEHGEQLDTDDEDWRIDDYDHVPRLMHAFHDKAVAVPGLNELVYTSLF
ncbi:hypothetical protein G7Z17_g6338 [Cylindrodendrum hubeiense]|uniref:Cytochrome P450 n=1 Tax=Cylindrodendrum hubeiense TaxID=595255 RepID=A0A9P5H5J8_9HYPO|nr:hypothetical protein G7Z17_g6338 [Cylindrodendrum hubeiense]